MTISVVGLLPSAIGDVMLLAFRHCGTAGGIGNWFRLYGDVEYGRRRRRLVSAWLYRRDRVDVVDFGISSFLFISIFLYLINERKTDLRMNWSTHIYMHV